MNRKHKLAVLMTGICALSSLACQKAPNMDKAPSPIEERIVTAVEQGPAIGVDPKAVEDLHAYTSAGEPSTPTFHYGRPASKQEVDAWGINVFPDGQGLPEGSGTVAEGKSLYAAKCASCHGLKGEGGEPYFSALVAKESSGKTIGSYWPYATTILIISAGLCPMIDLVP